MNSRSVFNTKRCALFCFCLGWFATMAPADTYPRQPGVETLNYVFRLTLSDDTDEIAGEAAIDLRFIKDNLTDFTLDLAAASGGKGMTVSEVQSAGAAQRFTHQADLLGITLGSPSKAGEQKQFIVRLV